MKKAVPGTAFFAGWLTAGSAIDRIFDLMLERGLVPEPPEEVQGSEVKI